ncbi:MAG: hypothetical protein SFX73_13275 [Kofleriaceae bacterium]|nr:hypothetical protein [Kofleriaceae bacterium]
MSRALPLLSALLVSACAPAATGVGVQGTVVTSGPPGAWDAGPDLVWAAPGVQVVAGWDQPVFFVDNGWWWWNDGGWMWWGPGGWAWAQPPLALRTHIRDPWRFRGWGAPGQLAASPRWYTYDRWFAGSRRWSPAIRDHRGGWRAPPAARSWSAPSRAGWSGGWGSRGATIRNHRR